MSQLVERRADKQSTAIFESHSFNKQMVIVYYECFDKTVTVSIIKMEYTIYCYFYHHCFCFGFTFAF